MDAMDPGWTLSLPGISKPTEVQPHDVVVLLAHWVHVNEAPPRQLPPKPWRLDVYKRLSGWCCRHCGSMDELHSWAALHTEVHVMVFVVEVSVFARLVLLGDVMLDYGASMPSIRLSTKACRQHFLIGWWRAPRATQWSPLPESAIKPKCSRNKRPRT
jgi:hypothetical protein